MYTQCPDCSTVFRVTAEALRVAQGRVRCGICSAGFNALDNLSEAPVPRALHEDRDEDTITVEELPGNEFIELSGATEDDAEEPTGREPAAAEEATGIDGTGEEGTREGPAGEEPADQPPAGDATASDDIDSDALHEEVTAAAEPVAEQSGEEEVATEAPAVEESAGEEPGDGQPEGVELPDREQADGEAADETPADAATEEDAEASAEDAPAGDPLEGIPDTALEFHGSAEDLERLFVPAGTQAYGGEPAPTQIPEAIDDIASRDLSGIEVREDVFDWPASSDSPFDPGNPAHVAAVLASSSAAIVNRQKGSLDNTDEYPVLVVEDYEAAQPPGERAGEEPHSGGEAPAAGDAVPEEAPLLIIPEELRHGPSTTAADDLAAPLDLDEEAPRRWPAVTAAALLAAVLGAQAVHHWRQDLVRNPATGPWMLRVSQGLGLDLEPPVDLGAFELRQLGAASDPGQAGRIRVRASIVNHAPFAQPYPLLRLSLQDRFGSTIGARNLAPEEYLPGAAADASGLIGASQRADAEVVFVDPGREAVGFELDVCTQGSSGLRCSADLPRSAP